MSVVAAFDGVCVVCARPYRHGDQVAVAVDLAGLRHAKCPPMTPPPRPHEPAAEVVPPPTWAATMADKGRTLTGGYRRAADDATRAALKAWARAHPNG